MVEGLGTKSIVARHVLERQGIDRFADVAYDTVAAILNDLCCVGALPLVVNAYFATGASEWYLQGERTASLLEGWRRACADAGCVWGGGESPSLPGMLAEQDIELAGAAVGAVPAGRAPILGERLAAGDEIVLVASSGLHANGASLARLVAGRLPDGYATPLPDAATTLGEALLEPSLMYVPLLAALLETDIELTYISHVTGHGLLKLMRPPKPLRYRIERLPAVPPCSASSSGRPAWTRRRRTRRSTWARAMPSTAPLATARGSSRSRGASASTRSSRGAWRRGPGRLCWSRWACASPGTGSSCPCLKHEPQVEGQCRWSSSGTQRMWAIPAGRCALPVFPTGCGYTLHMNKIWFRSSSRSPLGSRGISMSPDRMVPELPGSRRSRPSKEERI